MTDESNPSLPQEEEPTTSAARATSPGVGQDAAPRAAAAASLGASAGAVSAAQASTSSSTSGGSSGSSEGGPAAAASAVASQAADKPEVLIGAAFAGGFILAKLLRAIGNPK